MYLACRPNSKIRVKRKRVVVERPPVVAVVVVITRQLLVGLRIKRRRIMPPQWRLVTKKHNPLILLKVADRSDLMLVQFVKMW